MNNEFPLGEESKDFGDLPDLSGKYFKNLSGSEQDRFGAFSLTITEIRDASEVEVRDLFLRLQEGTTLTPPEKRNAMVGNMRDFIHELSSAPLLLKTSTKNDRFQHDDWIAHIARLELNKGPIDVKAADLKKLYEDEKSFKVDSKEAKKIKKVINFMNRVFADNTPELGIKWGFVDLYLLVSSFINNYDVKKRHQDFYDFYIGIEKDRRSIGDPADLLSAGGEWNRDLYDYISSFQREGAKRENIEIRHGVYVRKFLSDYPDLTPKDPKRIFNDNERLVIWRVANMTCQICKKEITLEEMHADHVKPHSKGGATTIENGQCLCSACNLKKSGS
ncbi:HNH endonuclease [bacterium]|nr:HNH endonuclease [bacterium]